MKRVETINVMRSSDTISRYPSILTDISYRIQFMNSLIKNRLFIIVFVLINLSLVNVGYSAVSVTAATGGTISADKAANATGGAFTALGNIVITEVNNGDFTTTGNLILTAPTGWSFNTSPDATPTASVTLYRDLTLNSISCTSNTITISLTVDKSGNKSDQLTISGIQVRANDGGNAPSSGNITASGTLPNGLTSSTNLGTLSQTVGALSKIVVTLPGQTFTDGATLAGSGNSTTVTPQVAGTAFNITLTATDQFFNKITSFVSTASITATGALTTGGGTTGNFSSGALTRSMNFSVGGNYTITATTPAPTATTFTSSSLTVNNPVPVINSITPTATGLTDFLLTVTGSKFNASSKIKLNNVEIVTTVVSASTLTANITYADIAAGGTFSVTVFNPTPGGGTSSGQTFTVNSWLGTTSDWNTASNWYNSVIPTSTTNVVIPSGGTQPIISSSAVCNNITINSGASLTINAQGSLTVSGNLKNSAAAGLSILSDATNTGSLIVNGNVTGSGSAQLTRTMTDKYFHLVTSPLSGQSIVDFLGDPVNATTILQGTAANDITYRGMSDFNPQTNAWNDYFKTTSSGSVTAGKGYSIRVRQSVSTKAVVFKGTLPTGDITTSGLEGGYWNCIGNPYTSAIMINSSGDAISRFLENNKDNLDEGYVSVYVWDPVSNSYTTVSNATVPYNLQQGQAFMVRMKAGVSSVSFNRTMQVHDNSVALKSTDNIWPTINLVATADTINSSTTIAFHEGMTPGLDPSYDAGLLKAECPIYVYTRLVDDYGIPFAIQALPSDQYDQLIIPVGVDYAKGGQVTFSAKGMYLPSSCSPLLEDRQLGILTNLNDHTYTADLTANTAGTGRFYLHTSYSSTGTNSRNSAPALTAWANGNQEINIKGQINNGAVASIFDLQGRLIVTRVMREGTSERISLPAVNPGIYLLQVRDARAVQVLKITLEQ